MMATEDKQQSEAKMEEKHDGNNSIMKKKDTETIKQLDNHKSILDTKISDERVKFFHIINWKYIYQALIASIFALTTLTIQWIIWKYLKISQCQKDIKYLSLNNLTTAIFDCFQNGFCWIFAFIYLITETIIDDDVYHYINLRKVRLKILCLTTFLSFILTMFVSFIHPILYYIRFVTYIVVIVMLYYILLYIFKKYIRYKIAVYLLLPLFIYIIAIAFIFAVGLLVVWCLKHIPYGFATVYPIYIAVAQTMFLAVMKNYHYVLCCSKAKYAVSATYDPNGFWSLNPITERYVCEEDGDLNNSRRVSVMVNHDNKQTQKIEENDDKQVDGRSVEYLWRNEWIYFICGLFITFIETMRISGMLLLRDDAGKIAISCFNNILMEILQRNNLFLEIFYGVFVKKCNPDRCKFDAIYYGVRARMTWQYIPIGVLFVMNILNYFDRNTKEDCYQSKLKDTYDILYDYWWILLVIYVMILLSDILSELIKWMLPFLKWISVDKQKDGSRKIIQVHASVFALTLFLITAVVISQNGYEMDLAIVHLFQGERLF